MAAEAVLVHDMAPPHPRHTQLTQMAADVARRTQGVLSIAINPGGKVLYPGQASLDAVRSGRVPLEIQSQLRGMPPREALLKVQLAQQHLLALGYTYPTSERLSAMVQNVLAPQSGGYSVTSISAGLTSFPPLSPLVAPYLPATR